MKKLFFVFLVLTGGASLSAQEGARDIILLVDTSTGMMPYYQQVGAYLAGPFLRENLRFNDTFHLISFGSAPRLEIIRRAAERSDIETIAARIWLLYPLEPSSDAGAALSYVERYVSSLPPGRPKKIFLISAAAVESQVSAADARLRPGAGVSFIKAPPAGAAQRPAGPAIPPASAGTAAPVSPPAPAAPSSPQPAIPGAGDRAAQTPPPSPAAPPPAVEPPRTSSPDPAPPQRPAASPASGADSPPPGGKVSVPGAGKNKTGFSFPLPPLIAAGIGVILIFGFIIALTARNLLFSPNRLIASARAILPPPEKTAAGKTAAMLEANRKSAGGMVNAPAAKGPAEAPGQSPEASSAPRSRPSQILENAPMLSLFVKDQNTAIGRRNVHTLKKGNVYTLGGGNADFLVFLVPLPSRIGQLLFDGKSCTFVPLKPRYFPDIGSSPVRDCIEKTIRAVSDKNYEIYFRFERFRDPLIALNQLLNSIKVPSTLPRPGEARADHPPARRKS
jgi:hypothetical protein